MDGALDQAQTLELGEGLPEPGVVDAELVAELGAPPRLRPHSPQHLEDRLGEWERSVGDPGLFARRLAEGQVRRLWALGGEAPGVSALARETDTIGEASAKVAPGQHQIGHPHGDRPVNRDDRESFWRRLVMRRRSRRRMRHRVRARS